MPSSEVIAHDLTMVLISGNCANAGIQDVVDKYFELFPQVQKAVIAKMPVPTANAVKRPFGL